MLRDFAIDQLLAATDLDQLRAAVEKIFTQFRQIRQQQDCYPANRAILLLETVIKDFNEQLLKILSNYKIMHLAFAQFYGLRKDVNKVFQMVEKKILEFKENIKASRTRVD